VALSWADPTLICPGYLFNTGAPAVPLSKTTNIEEFSRQQERLEETIAMEEDSKSSFFLGIMQKKQKVMVFSF